MKSGYSIYNKIIKAKTKHNWMKDVFPKLPKKKYDVILADPPWDYNGKTQFDKTLDKKTNIGYKKSFNLSAACFQYPTMKISELTKLRISKICKQDCILFMWTTGPQMANAIKLGTAWGFEYKTIAFVWDKQVHNPGNYTLSQTEFVLAFKKGKFPSPRGARNIRQLVSIHRLKHSEKPIEFNKYIHKMFPTQDKIELFARRHNKYFDTWGLEI